MSWVVDTCVILDVLENDETHGLPSARLLENRLKEGLLISPVTHVELAPAFAGDLEEQKRFLNLAGIGYDEAWSLADTELAHTAWQRHVAAWRIGKTRKRPLADILIGAFAANRGGLITRNPHDFRSVFPKLEILEP